MWVVADLDDDYIRKMEDVLERPYDPEQPVVCLDEKTDHAWKFDRKAARKTFGYNCKAFKRSKT